MNNLNVILFSSLLFAMIASPAWFGALIGASIGLVSCISIDVLVYFVSKMASRQNKTIAK